MLIIDDASPDETPEVAAALARQDKRVTYRRHEANRGHIETYNEGIAWARADYMMLLSADDYLLPGALSRAVGLMDRHPEVGFSFGDALVLEPHRTQRIRPQLRLSRGESAKVLSGRSFLEFCVRQGETCFHVAPTPTVLAVTALQQRIGGYLPGLPHCGDLEMWLRFAAHSSVGYLRIDQAVYRRHESNMSLAYAQDNILPDLQQHRSAFNAFLDVSSSLLPDSDRLHALLMRSLSRLALGHASVAFNADKQELCNRIADFALEIYPDADRSVAWRKLALKRKLGHRFTSALLPLAGAARQVVSALRTLRYGS